MAGHAIPSLRSGLATSKDRKQVCASVNCGQYDRVLLSSSDLSRQRLISRKRSRTSVVRIGGREVGEHLGTVDALPYERVVGHLVDVVPTQFL